MTREINRQPVRERMYGVYLKRTDGSYFLAHWDNNSMAIFTTLNDARLAQGELDSQEFVESAIICEVEVTPINSRF